MLGFQCVISPGWPPIGRQLGLIVTWCPQELSEGGGEWLATWALLIGPSGLM
jgi:hypothetical protein